MRKFKVHNSLGSFVLAKSKDDYEIACVTCAIIPGSDQCSNLHEHSKAIALPCGERLHWVEDIIGKKYPKRILKTQ